MSHDGFDWRQMTLGMVSMVTWMLWERNKRRIYLVALAATGIYVAKIAVRSSRLASIRKRRRQKRDSTMKHLENTEIYTSEKDRITKMSFSELREALHNKVLSVSTVMDAYLMKAAQTHKKTNCVVEIVTEAKNDSKQLDSEGCTDKLLFGIPFSIKENYHIQNTESTMGCSRMLGNPATEDSVVVQMLKYHGAVPFVKTNVPQTMLSYETTNPIYGATRNPHDVTRGVGGSSGGEAALIASEGSILGFGTDIGGSIRIPSHMCGICGFKPTCGRISREGVSTMGPGQQCVPTATGPMARDVDTLMVAMKAVLDPHVCSLDKRQVYLPFNDQIYESTKKLKIGYYKYDGFFHATAACQRAVDVGVEMLQQNGHTVIPWDFTDYGRRGFALFGKAMTADGGETLLDLLKDDSTDAAVGMTSVMLNLPDKLISALSYALKFIFPRSAMPANVGYTTGVGSVAKYYNLIEQVKKFQDDVIADWSGHGFDVVIGPALCTTAMKLNVAGRTQGGSNYTAVYNVLNFPAGVLPVTKVTSQDVQQRDDYPVIDLWHYNVKKSIPGSEGLPVGLQVVGLPWQEEQCLRVMKEIETAVKENETRT